jgi:D-alanine-D-alanine ligase
MRIGLAFDLKTAVEAAPGLPDDGSEEYDSPETIDSLASELKRLGHEAVLLGGGRTFLQNVLTERVDLVFNIAEGRGCYRAREAQVPGALEMLGIPYVGSDPLTLALCLDKPLTKQIVSGGGVVTPRYQVIETADDLLHFRDSDINFPVIVKPAFEGSSKGIHQNSRIDHPDRMYPLVRALLETYRQPALVEEFVPGIEVTVGLVGHHSPQVLGVMQVEPLHGPDENFMYTLEVKRNWRQMVGYRCPPIIPQEWVQRIEDAALTAFKVLGCRDMARIDFRVDRRGQAYFIEANPLPGLSPVYGDLPIMGGLTGWDYPRLVCAILDSALERYGMVHRKYAHRTAV